SARRMFPATNPRTHSPIPTIESELICSPTASHPARSNPSIFIARDVLFPVLLEDIAFSDGDASHGRPRGEIHWARRSGVRRGSWAQGGLPRSVQCPRRHLAAFGIARQSDAGRPARRVGGHFGRCPRTAESRGRRFGVAA